MRLRGPPQPSGCIGCKPLKANLARCGVCVDALVDLSATEGHTDSFNEASLLKDKPARPATRAIDRNRLHCGQITSRSTRNAKQSAWL